MVGRGILGGGHLHRVQWLAADSQGAASIEVTGSQFRQGMLQHQGSGRSPTRSNDLLMVSWSAFGPDLLQLPDGMRTRCCVSANEGPESILLLPTQRAGVSQFAFWRLFWLFSWVLSAVRPLLPALGACWVSLGVLLGLCMPLWGSSATFQGLQLCSGNAGVHCGSNLCRNLLLLLFGTRHGQVSDTSSVSYWRCSAW